MATSVTISLEEFDSIRNENKRLGEQVAQLQNSLADLKTNGLRLDEKELLAMIRSGIEITQYAIANLSPEFSKKWPYEALRSLADRMRALPSYTPHDEELAFEMHKFARECETFERRRAIEGERYIPEPSAGRPIVDDSQLARLPNQLGGALPVQSEIAPSIRST